MSRKKAGTALSMRPLTRMKRAIAAIAASLLMLPGNAALAQTLQKITITYASNDANQSAPLVAVQKGYFAAEGLDVELQYAGGGTATPALISGSIQASGSASSALTAILKDAPLRVVGVIADSPTYSLWVTSDIKSAADLKGKTIGVATRGDTLEVASRFVSAIGRHLAGRRRLSTARTAQRYCCRARDRCPIRCRRRRHRLRGDAR